MILSVVVPVGLVVPVVLGAERWGPAGGHMGPLRAPDSPTRGPRPDGPSGLHGTSGITRTSDTGVADGCCAGSRPCRQRMILSMGEGRRWLPVAV